MARLVKGAKWTYGWVVVSPAGAITIPPQAWDEFGFQQGDEAIFMPGSRRSGGFAISTPILLASMSGQLEGATSRILARGRFGDGQVSLPPEISLQPGTKLLAARGSRFGLGFIAQGPIYEEALKQTNRLEVFGC
jgi:hypothetical protein